MKRLIPVLLFGVAAALAIAKLRVDAPLPERPLGSWELDDHDSPE